MFSIHCPVHGSEVLLSERRIRGIDRTEAGLRVRYECWCGHRGAFASGRPAAHQWPVAS
jgi:hypothetical protein